MEPKVFRYRDFQTFLEEVKAGCFQLDGPVLTATRDLARAWVRTMPDMEAYPVAAVLKAMLPWQRGETRRSQFLLLGRVVDGLQGVGEEDRQVLTKNGTELLRSFRELITDGVEPEALEKVPGLPRGFTEAFAAFSREAASGTAEFREQVLRGWKDPGAFRDALGEVAFTYRGKKRHPFQNMAGKVPTVFLEGFYYITPLQDRLFRAFANAGFQVVYLNNYDPDVKDAYQIWDENVHFQHLPTQDIGEGYPRKKFAWVWNGGAREKETGVTFQKYGDVFAFVRSYDRLEKERGPRPAVLYTPSGKEARKFLDTFFADTPEKRHLLSYPFGQYVQTLYSMWNPGRHSVELTVEAMHRCIASGFATDAEGKASDSRQYLQYFDRIAAWFSDCRTIEDWKVRGQQLQKLMTDPSVKNASGENRWKTILEEPKKSLGLFACPTEALVALSRMVQNTADEAESLFGGEGKEADLYEQFRKLMALMEKRKSWPRLTEEERKVFQLLEERVSRHPVYGSRCLKDLLPQAMTLVLGGEEELSDGGTGDIDGDVYNQEKGEINYSDDGLSLLGQLEAAPVVRVDSQGRRRRLVLTFCDASHMPGRVKPYPWPLTRELAGQLGEVSGEETASYLSDFVFVMDHTVLANRYLFFLALQNDDVHITWFSEKQDGKPAAPTPYMGILGMQAAPAAELTGSTLEKETGSGAALDFASLTLGEHDSQLRGITGLRRAFKDRAAVPMEIEFDRRICPYRLAYDFILEPYPCFTSRYHLSKISECLPAPFIRKVKGEEGEDTAKAQIYWERAARWFPFLNPSEMDENHHFCLTLKSGQFIITAKLHKNGIGVSEKIDGDMGEKYQDKFYNLIRTNALFTAYFGTEVYWKLIDLTEETRQDKGRLRKKLCSLCPHCETCFFRFNEDRPDVEELELPLINLHGGQE